jgi:hypothetical protein
LEAVRRVLTSINPRCSALKANPDKAQRAVRARALIEGKVLYMAVPRLADQLPFYLLDPERLILQPEIVIFMAAGRLAVGSGRHERGLAGGVATTTSATGGRYQRRVRRPAWRTGVGSHCRSMG